MIKGIKDRLRKPFDRGRFALWSGALFFAGVCILSLFARLGWAGDPGVAGWIGHPAVTIAAVAVTIAIYGGMGYLINRQIGTRAYVGGLLLIALGLRVFWVLQVDTQPASDFKVLYDNALKAATGDFAFGKADYYIRWVYQLGYTLYQGLIIHLFGPSLVPLKLFNALFETATVWIVYRMAGNLFGEPSGRIAGLIYATYVPNIIMCSVLSNQHLSTMLFAAGCWIAVSSRERKGVRAMAAVALLFALGAIFRPMGSFYAGVFLLFLLVYEGYKDGTLRRRASAFAKKAAVFVAVYLIMQQIVAYSLIAAGITELKLHESQEPYWKFMVGMNAESNGHWNAEDAEFVILFAIGPERNKIEKRLLLERSDNPAEMAALFVRKWAMMWAGNDDSGHWSLSGVADYDLAQKLLSAERAQYIAYAFFGLLTFVLLLRKRQHGKREAWDLTASGSSIRSMAVLLPILVILAYAALHLVVEIQVRYRLDILPFYIVLASYGCWQFSAGLHERLFHKRPTGSGSTAHTASNL